MPDLILFIGATAALLATPGPTNALLATSAALVGFRRSTPLMLAEIAGYFITIGLLLVVSRPLIAAFPAFGVILRGGLVLYLVWLALRLWQAGHAEAKEGEVISPRRVFVTTLLNPKGLVFAFGIFPPLAGPEDVILHFGAFALTTLTVAAGWLTFGTSLGRLASRSGWEFRLSRVTSVVLASFACIVTASIFKAG
jgi:threonine/homoserine/homoserine lactone efflux protein